jgi:Rhodopirellula transposase DDE domain
MHLEQKYKHKYQHLFPNLNERARRLTAAADAQLLGHGGVSLVHRASGLARSTIQQGFRDLADEPLVGRIRRPGGGRKSLIVTDQTLQDDLTKLVDPHTRGDPMSPLRWVSKSTRHLASALRSQGHAIGHVSIQTFLKALDYTLQSNVKSKEAVTYKDRDKQFETINETAKDFLAAGDPVISVDTKKKELIGEYKNPGKEWLPQGKPREVNSHDFGDKDEHKRVMKAAPYGVYDVAGNDGYVTVGITHDTAEFAVQGIRNWWNNLGKQRYPNTTRLLITPDAGGSNGYRVRLWKVALQQFADESGLTITVRHFPSGTSKWNKIEHRLFSFITKNWQGVPLTSYQLVVDLIAATRTTKGLKVYAQLDETEYETKKAVTDEQMAALNITTLDFHPELNYTIAPRELAARE